MKYGSKLVEEAVQQFSTLPGIGKKTALRLVLHILNEKESYTTNFTSALEEMRQGIKRCKTCCNISDEEICGICEDKHRDKNLICVVESIRDVMAIEATDQFKGVYHVLGGVISPLEGIGPSDLFIEELISRISQIEEDQPEVILAISPTIDGETTSFYLFKLLAKEGVKVSQISRGISFGGELEYADELTLGRSIQSRLPYDVGGKVSM
ncbi:MAG: recombination mediator RecR [Saprospiraceae bacterium]|nr:recombination mediator RecR [Saprospiraceae bacterium]